MADITVTNSGTITSTIGIGVEIVSFDLNASVIVTNEPGASIHAAEQALRITAMTLNANGTGTWLIDNGGLMESTGDGFAAIDLRDLIAAGGTITVNNGAAGIIRAAGGDAIAAGTNTTVSNHGQIIAFDGTLVNSDGIDFGTHAGGRVDNFSDGTITGARYGITGGQALIVNNSGSITGGDGAGIGAFGGSTITNMGTIASANGFAIDAGFGNFIDTITNQGSILGRVFTGGGDDVLSLYTGSSISGQIDGGTGTDTLNLLGTGTGTLADVLDFEDLNVQAGTWTIVDVESFSAGVTISAGATLRLEQSALSAGLFANTIDGFTNSSTVDLAGIGLATGATLGAGNLLTISGGAVDPITLQFDPTQSFAGEAFILTDDGAGGTDVTLGQIISGGSGSGIVTGTPGNDLITTGNGSNTINSGNGNDRVISGNGNDVFNAGNGNNVLDSGNGNDILTVGNGNNVMTGGNGSDTFRVGTGDNTLTGGNGADLFEFGPGFGNNVITDFSHADHIEFDGAVFHNFQAVQAASQQVGADTVISLGTNHSVTLLGVSLNSLRASDFILN
jgi:Ca2+-binding RTX toxin-like protein